MLAGLGFRCRIRLSAIFFGGLSVNSTTMPPFTASPSDGLTIPGQSRDEFWTQVAFGLWNLAEPHSPAPPCPPLPRPDNSSPPPSLHWRGVGSDYSPLRRQCSASATASKMSIRQSSLVHSRRFGGKRELSSSGKRAARY